MVALALLLSTQACAHLPQRCQPNWYVTGYYTPVETDYAGAADTTISINDQGDQVFSEAFLAAVKVEGWGKTRFGWYLGYYGNQWHRSAQPLDALGQTLNIGTVATDPMVVTTGSRVVIENMESSLPEHQFVARDVGALVKRNHIDVYTGEGEAAKHLTWQITGQRTVCVYPT